MRPAISELDRRSRIQWGVWPRIRGYRDAVDEKDIAREGFEPVDVLSVCAGILDAVVFSTGFFENILRDAVSRQEREPEITADDDSIVVGKRPAKKAFRIDFVDFQGAMCVPEYMQKHLLSLLSFG